MESLRESDLLFMELGQLLSTNNLNLFDQVTTELFFMVDPISGDCIYISKSAEDILGYPKEDLNIPFFISIIHDDDRASVLRYYYSCSQDRFGPKVGNKRRLKCTDFRVRHLEGNWIWVALNCVLVSNRQHNLPEVFFGGVRDITKRKEEELSLMNTIHTMHRQKQEYNGESSIKSTVFNHQMENIITPREKEVLRLIGHGYSSREIAAKLFVSAHTVIKHRKNIIAKFKVKNTAQLIREASKLYWL